MPSFQVAVCGPREENARDNANAHEVGRLLAQSGATVLCGGGSGVMAAVAEGAFTAGGLVIGIRPNANPAETSPHLSATIYTRMGEARNAILITSADAVIVIGGSWGTLSELALANHRTNIPVISLNGWQITDAHGNPINAGITAATPKEAVEAALRSRSAQ